MRQAVSSAFVMSSLLSRGQGKCPWRMLSCRGTCRSKDNLEAASSQLSAWLLANTQVPCQHDEAWVRAPLHGI